MAAYTTDTTGNYGKNAYMLVYERKHKKDIREIDNNKPEAPTNLINYS